MSAGRRSARGRGVYPPNPAQWPNERNALGVRADLGLKAGQRFPVRRAFSELLPAVVLRPHGELPCARITIEQFRGRLRSTWSALAIQLDDGEIQVIYNDSHSPERRRATLMEEFFHLHLGHPPSVLRFYSRDGAGRTFDSEIERTAFASGAAALAPYADLRQMVAAGLTATAIAKTLGVSKALVVYRCKVTKLYAKLKGPGV